MRHWAVSHRSDSSVEPSLWGEGAEKHAKGMIPHPDGGRHRFSGEKCRSKISKCSSAAFMGFIQRFPNHPSVNCRAFGLLIITLCGRPAAGD